MTPPASQLISYKETNFSLTWVRNLINATKVYYETKDHEEQKEFINSRFNTETSYSVQMPAQKPKSSTVPIFEDPLMVVHGTNNVRLQFRSLIKFFKTIHIEPVEYESHSVPGKSIQDMNDNELEKMFALKTPGRMGTNSIDLEFFSNQSYTLNSGKKIDLQQCRTVMTLDKETERILKHTDTWEKAQPNGEWKVHQVVGKPIVGFFTCTLFKLIGW